MFEVKCVTPILTNERKVFISHMRSFWKCFVFYAEIKVKPNNVNIYIDNYFIFVKLSGNFHT